MRMHVHTLTPGHILIRQRGKDPLTGERLRPGDRVVVCACHQLAFLEDSWPTECEDHGGRDNTLNDLSRLGERIRIGRDGETRSDAGGQPPPRPPLPPIRIRDPGRGRGRRKFMISNGTQR